MTRAPPARGPDSPRLPSGGWCVPRMAENPGRFGLLDLTDWDLSEAELGRALAVQEPQASLRDGTLLVPRLATSRHDGRDRAAPWTPSGTVLITGGTGTLGRLFARHLVTEHGVRHLLLASRRGPDAAGAGAGRRTRPRSAPTSSVAACDVADRDGARRAAGRDPRATPAHRRGPHRGVLDDGALARPDARAARRRAAPQGRRRLAPARADRRPRPGRVRPVLLARPAPSAAPGRPTTPRPTPSWTRSPQHRRALGLPATSLAWGLWARGQRA